MALKIWQVSFTYDEHEMETDYFVAPDNPRPTTYDGRKMLIRSHGNGYMEDVHDNPELLTVDAVTLFDTCGDMNGNPYKIIVQE